MNYNIGIISVLLAVLFVAHVAADDGNNSDADDKRLAQIYDKMKDASQGVAINLDNNFGGGRCNCVCKENN